MDNCTIFALNVRNQEIDSKDTVSIDCTMKETKINFEKLYAENFNKVIYFSNSFLYDINEAENIAQDVFAALWKNRDHIEAQTAVAYIFTSAKNMCLNNLKRRNQTQKYNSYRTKTDLLNLIALENSGSLDIYQKDVQDIINKGTKQMNKKVKRTFLLSRLKGLKNREIADIEDVVESTIEARMTSALLVMKRMLKDYLE